METIGKIIGLILFIILGVPFLVTVAGALVHVLPIIIGIVAVVGFFAMFSK